MPGRRTYRERRASTLGGVGSGLGLITVAHSLPTNLDWARGILEYLAPVASVVIALAWAHVLASYQRRQLMQRLSDATKIRDRVLASPASSKEAKARVQHDLERVELLVTQLLVAEAEDLAGMDSRLPDRASAETDGAMQKS